MEKPSKGAFSGVIIVYRTDRYPNSITDGTRIYKGYGSNSSAGGFSTVTLDLPSENTNYYFVAIGYAVKNGAEWLSSSLFSSALKTNASRYTFTSSGTFTVPIGVSRVNVFCVGGGGGGNTLSAGTLDHWPLQAAGAGGSNGGNGGKGWIRDTGGGSYPGATMDNYGTGSGSTTREFGRSNGTLYSGGGGGGSYSVSPGAGGSGGGGAGAMVTGWASQTAAVAGTNGLGGGGGGGSYGESTSGYLSQASRRGGSGIVIIEVVG